MTFVITLFLGGLSAHALRTAVLFPAGHGTVPSARSLTLTSEIHKRITVYQLTVKEPSGRPAHAVIPRSLARAVEANVNRFAKSLARGPAAAGAGPCDHPVEIAKATRRLALCLDLVPRVTRTAFLDWYNSTAATLE